MKKLPAWVLGILLLPCAQTGAFAQCSGGANTPAGLSSAVGFDSTANTANTAFGTQTNAFVGGPTGTQVNAPGGGVWVRGVAGNVTNSATGTVNPPGAPSFTCNSKFDQSFEGFQLGADVARFNTSDGRTNFYAGVTGGDLNANGHEVTGLATAHFSLPFVGVYAAMIRGGFFTDILYRHDFFSGDISQPQFGLAKQGISGSNDSVAGSIGYQYPIGNSSFIEPSAALIWSDFHINPIPIPGAGANAPGTAILNPISSLLGRAGVRIGTTLTPGNIVWTPYIGASIWNEFEGNSTQTFLPAAGPPGTGFSVTRVGTYGQYVAGIAASVPNTGWLGYARLDYRDGENIHGWTVNAGLRYQFYTAAAAPEPPILRK